MPKLGTFIYKDKWLLHVSKTFIRKKIHKALKIRHIWKLSKYFENPTWRVGIVKNRHDHYFIYSFTVSFSWRGVLDITLCDKVCQWLATGQWFFSGYSRFPTPIKLITWYNWNIVESGVKYHKPKPSSRLVLNSNHSLEFQNNMVKYG